MHELGALLDEEMSEDERRDLKDAEEVCRRFLAWNMGASRADREGNVKRTLAGVLGRDAGESETG